MEPQLIAVDHGQQHGQDQGDGESGAPQYQMEDEKMTDLNRRTKEFFCYSIDNIVFQFDKSSRWSEETMLKEYKEKLASRSPGTWTKTGCASRPSASGCQIPTNFYSEELIKGFQDARKSSFDIKKLTKRELDFLMEYVCN